MKIAEIILDLRKRAGAEVFFYSLCVELSKRKEIELTIISLWDDFDDSFKALKQLPGVRFYSLGKKKGVDIKASKRLRKIIKDVSPDIVHTHRSILLTYFLAFGFKKRNWKLVHTIHNTPSMEANRVTWMLRKKYVKKKAISFVGISDLISRQFDEILPNCDLYTIYNGIELRNIHSDGMPKYDLIIVARFSAQKNHKLLFDAFNDLYTNNPSLTLACLGDGELLDYYKDYINPMPCNHNIIFYGSREDVYPFLKDSKIFVLTSNYEGNPISVLEAMDCGLPVVAPRVGGLPDVIKDKRNGTLFDAGDIEGLKNAITSFLENHDLYNLVSKNNRDDITNYSIQHCVKQYLELFSLLMRLSHND